MQKEDVRYRFRNWRQSFILGKFIKYSTQRIRKGRVLDVRREWAKRTVRNRNIKKLIST